MTINKTTKRIITYVVYLTVGLLIAYAIYFFVSIMHSTNKLSVADNPAFRISRLLDINDSNVIAETEVLKDNTFFGYDCQLQDGYLITVVLLGKVLQKEHIANLFSFSAQAFEERDNWFNYDVIPISFAADNLHSSYWLWSNVSLLPFDTISSIDIFTSDAVLAQGLSAAGTHFFQIEASRILLSFNASNKTDLGFAYKKSDHPPKLYLFFYSDNDNNLYAGIITSDSRTIGNTIFK